MWGRLVGYTLFAYHSFCIDSGDQESEMFGIPLKLEARDLGVWISSVTSMPCEMVWRCGNMNYIFVTERCMRGCWYLLQDKGACLGTSIFPRLQTAPFQYVASSLSISSCSQQKVLSTGKYVMVELPEHPRRAGDTYSCAGGPSIIRVAR